MLIASMQPILVPVIWGRPRDVLEIGCGDHPTVTALGLTESRFFALDIDLDALRHLKRRQQTHAVCGDGERLPFEAARFDLLICLVALPYMNIPIALGEMSRVMRPGGQLFVTLHGYEMAWERITRDLRGARYRDLAYQLYAVLNGVSLGVVQTQFRWPVNRARCESVQSAGAIRRALHRAGFDGVVTERKGQVFAVGARKSGPAPS